MTGTVAGKWLVGSIKIDTTDPQMDPETSSSGSIGAKTNLCPVSPGGDRNNPQWITAMV